MFAGLSTLRAKEKSKEPLSEQAKKLQQYLAQQYGAGAPVDSESGQKKKKKKKKPVAFSTTGGVKILDEDVSGFSASKLAAQTLRARADEIDDDDNQDDDGPVIANPEEAQRLQQIAAKEKQFFSTGQDGSGWAREASPGHVPARRQRHDSPDASLPRRQRHDSPDASPLRRQRHDSPDASPPRRRRHDSPDASPPRRQRHDSPDASPTRLQRHDSPDASPPRRQRHDSPDASPPRRRGGAQQPVQAQLHPDLSPPRKRGGSEVARDEADKRRRMMSDGTSSGMISARELVEEMQRKREEERRRFADLDKDITGKGAQTVYRDKEGRRLTKEEYEEQQAAARKKQEYESERDLAWGGGLKQRQDAEARAEEMRREAARPFARSRDDAELDSLHRERVRWGDPMAHLVKKKQPLLEEPVPLVQGAHGERLKKSGFIIPQQVPPHSWLRRGVGAPPNRFNIKPGRHWDGVDRSNGFEQKMFKTQTELRRREQEAWQWAQEDM